MVEGLKKGLEKMEDKHPQQSKCVPCSKPIDQYNVVLHNDETNTLDRVVFVLKSVFRIPKKKASKIATDAQANGSAVCITEPLEHAEFHVDWLRDNSLCVTLEKEKEGE